MIPKEAIESGPAELRRLPRGSEKTPPGLDIDSPTEVIGYRP